MALLDLSRERSIVLPARVQLHLLQAGVASGAGWEAVRVVMGSDFEGGVQFGTDGMPLQPHRNVGMNRPLM